MRITGIDPNPEMAPFAVEAAQSAKLNTAQITLLQGTAEQLPVDSQSQDAVVCTLVSSPQCVKLLTALNANLFTCL